MGVSTPSPILLRGLRPQCSSDYMAGVELTEEDGQAGTDFLLARQQAECNAAEPLSDASVPLSFCVTPTPVPPAPGSTESRRPSLPCRRVLCAGLQRAAGAALAGRCAGRHSGPLQLYLPSPRRARPAGGHCLAGEWSGFHSWLFCVAASFQHDAASIMASRRRATPYSPLWSAPSCNFLARAAKKPQSSLNCLKTPSADLHTCA